MAINKALFIEQLRRFWAIPALALVVLVVGVYMPLFNVTDWVFSSRLNNILTMRHFLMLLVMVLTPVAAAFCTFGMFFNKKTATAFYSMPINKTQILLTNALAGIVLSLTPMLVFSLLMLPYAGYAGSEVFWLLFMLSIGSVFYFAVAWLAFSLAGHGFVALCLMVVIPFVPISLVWATEAIGSLFVFGFAGLFDMDTQNLIFIYHTPAVWGQLFWDGVGGFERNVLFPAISYVVISLALFVAAFFISRARQVERTGDSVIFRPVKHVLIFLFSFMGMWFIGLIFFAFGRSTANMHVGLVVGFAISYMAAQMIAEKTFLIFGKLKYLPIYGGTAIGLYVFMLLFTQFGMGFYVNRIPSTANIYGVYVSNSFLHGGLSNEEWRLMAFTDAEAIESTRAAHR
ncbi:MAG: hypothetical protein FWB80_14790, partial [Defluviitaleaceae bacterium]|nr:hypothetical protein [Defluviitaleaceae bacterium]